MWWVCRRRSVRASAVATCVLGCSAGLGRRDDACVRGAVGIGFPTGEAGGLRSSRGWYALAAADIGATNSACKYETATPGDQRGERVPHVGGLQTMVVIFGQSL